MSPRILVVDDDEQIVRLLQSYLSKEGMTVFTAADGLEAMHIVRREWPDLVVLDLMLPARDGWEVARLMRAEEPLAKIPILMLTARVEDDDKILGFELGADDYVTKPFNPREMVMRVRAILRRAAGLPRPSIVLQVGRLRLDDQERAASLDGRALDLTPSEFAILRALMKNASHTLTRGELIEAAFGYEYEGMERTVDSHVKNLRKKIEPGPAQPAYIETVYGVGYRLSDPNGEPP
ncbi:MAG: response regulator transcription factor [Chloroflexi bacterium]|nr:response regulator transcription factor [Chloroflexota bacterium]MBI3731873.1 response regulator transcription factor [Chloroflexota bacterium]